MGRIDDKKELNAISKDFIFAERNERINNYSMPKLHSHNFYEIYFLEKGSRQVLFSDKIVSVPENSLVIIPPFTMHKTDGESYVRTNVYIAKESLNPFTESVLLNEENPPYITLEGKDLSDVKSILEELVKLSDEANGINDNAVYIKHILADTLILIISRAKESSPISEKAPANVPHLVLAVLNYLEDHYAEDITIAFLAEKFYVSSVTLCTQFKKYIHYTIGEYLTLLRVNKAKYLLARSAYSMEKIASMVGFSSGNYFSMVFKRIVGKAPSAYKTYSGKTIKSDKS